MLIELKWLDSNTSQNHRTEIYRSLNPFSDITEATLIATTDKGVTTYADADVVLDVTYYYRLRVIQDGYKSPLSKLFEFKANQYTGPGPTRTVFGDEHFGYYGQFPLDPAIVPTINQVRTALGLGPLPDGDSNVATHKFAIGGRVRGIHSAPVAIGSEISRTNALLQPLLVGGSTKITLGLHTWEIIIPSTATVFNPNHVIEHFPGELRSMLGVVTDLYSRVEDALTGNRTGNRLLVSQGQVSFYSILEDRFPEGAQWIATSDWEGTTGTVINWTGQFGPPPLPYGELHFEPVDYTVPGNWEKTIIWPVLVYTGLTGPK